MNTRTASTLRLSTIISAAGVFALSLMGSTAANAQTYVGQAYDTGVGVLFLGVGINGVQIASTGGNVSSTVANADANTSLLGLVGGSLTTGVATASSVGAAGAIDSKAVVNGLDLPIVNVSLIGLGLANVSLQATTITSETTATFSGGGPVGRSTIENLVLDQTIAGAVVGHTTLVADGSVNQFIAANLLPAGIASIELNEQIFNTAGTVLTTNAIDVKVLGQTANVVIASSTAGFTGAAASAPEPGSMPLIAAGLPFLLGGIGIGRRKMANRRSAKA